jgi:hypothetical protein
MEITNGKVTYRTPSPFEAPATSVELVFTLASTDVVEDTVKGALAQARNIAESMGREPAKEAAKPAEKKTRKPAKAAEKKADPMADAEPAKPAEKKADPMADDAPKADTKGGVVDLDADLEDGGEAEVISDAKLQEAVRKEAGRLTGKVVKAKMNELYGKEQMSGIPNEKRAEFIKILAGMEPEQ